MIVKNKKKLNTGTVQQIEQVSFDSYYIEIETDKFESKAGQFISILCEGTTLRRPFSIASQDGNKIGILFKKKGKGTKYLKSLSNGDKVDFLGALGNGFNILNKKSLLIGAGVGVAPIFYLQKRIEKLGIPSFFVTGYKNKKQIIKNINSDLILTDDGSRGQTGSVVDVVPMLIEDYMPEVIYACGPRIVLQKITEIAKKANIETQIAMEKVMACGVGVCKGCAIRIIKNGIEQNATVCKDGPVFKGDEIVW